MTLSRPIKLLAGLLGGLFGMALFWCLALCWMFGSNPFHPNPFDTLRFNQHDWLEDHSCVDGSNRRGHMAEDITRHHLRPGMVEAQVVALLGPPDHVYTQVEVRHHINAYKHGDEMDGYFQPCDLQAAKVDDYYLGEELSMGWGVDRGWLLLYLDAQGRYVGCRICS